METFTYDRQKGAAGKIEFRTRTAQFGDGYSQAVADGINAEMQTWPLSFEGNLETVQPILDFFRRHQGYKSFYWTAPGDTGLKMWRVGNVQLTSAGAGVYNLSAEFKQVYV